MLLREYAINRVSLLCAFIGVVFLFLYSYYDAPKNVRLSDLTEKDVHSKVIVDAVVVSSGLSNNTLIFEINDGDRFKCVLFNPSLEQRIVLQKGNFVRIFGKVSTYKGELEIIVEKVWLLD
ncbi:MAG: OB-fold nucleic acid binding domain-containing protein [Candidatus Diapherotrites archaeon]